MLAVLFILWECCFFQLSTSGTETENEVELLPNSCNPRTLLSHITNTHETCITSCNNILVSTGTNPEPAVILSHSSSRYPEHAQRGCVLCPSSDAEPKASTVPVNINVMDLFIFTVDMCVCVCVHVCSCINTGVDGYC